MRRNVENAENGLESRKAKYGGKGLVEIDKMCSGRRWTTVNEAVGFKKPLLGQVLLFIFVRQQKPSGKNIHFTIRKLFIKFMTE